jgi:poly(3-hydroxybutyrate) depolymerase
MSVASCPPAAEAFGPDLGGHVLPSALNAWTAGLEGWAAYSAQAFRRGAGPWTITRDLVRWFDAMTDRRPPTWSSPNEVVWETPLARLRDFTDGSRADVVPTLVLPPQAGHSSCIVDYSDAQSQMKVIRAAGLERSFSLDWIGATQETKNATIEDYIALVDRAVQHAGGTVNLIGDCQGGWLATIYAALHPERINTLTIAGAPIDFRAGDAVIHAYVQALSQGPDMGFYERVIALGDGVLKGEFMLNGFIVIRPESEVSKQLELLAHLDDADHVARYRAFEDWFKFTQDIPGAFYLWIVEQLFRDNRLVEGTLEVGGERVDLGRITCPLFLLGGADDHITPPEQVFAIADHAGTKERDVVRRVTSGGHLGLFMGTEALRDHWPEILTGVAERSKRTKAKPADSVRLATPRRRRPIPAP